MQVLLYDAAYLVELILHEHDLLLRFQCLLVVLAVLKICLLYHLIDDFVLVADHVA